MDLCFEAQKHHTSTIKKWCIRVLLYIISLMKTNDSSVWGKRLKLKSLFTKNLDIQVGSFHWITWWSSSKNESQICVTFFLPEKKIFWKMYLFFFHTMKVSFGPLLLSLTITIWTEALKFQKWHKSTIKVPKSGA